MPAFDGVVMGPPGCGKTYLAKTLANAGLVRYLELEPVLVERFGTGEAFQARKGEALEFIRDSLIEQLERPGLPVAIETTGVSEGPLLSELAAGFRLAFVCMDTPRATCVERVRTRDQGRNLDNDPARAASFHEFWHASIAPRYKFDLTLAGDDTQSAEQSIRGTASSHVVPVVFASSCGCAITRRMR